MHLAVRTRVLGPRSNEGSALSAVRAATRSLHEELEGRLVLSRRGAGAAEYRAYASALYAWLAPFEAQLWSASWPSDVEPALRDGKREWLRADLAALDVALPETFAPSPALDTRAARFGLAYVVEGSQLGGQVLARRFGPALAPVEPRYLVGYGSETGPRWKSFVASLERTIVAPDEIAATAQAAHDAFAGLAAWLGARGAA